MPTSPDDSTLQYAKPDIEAAFLGAALIDPRVALTFAEVPIAWFTRPLHRQTWKAMQTLLTQGQHVDYLSVVEWMETGADADTRDTAADLVELVNRTPSSVHAPTYVDVLRSAWRQRAVARIVTKALSVNHKSADDAIAYTLQALASLEARDTRGGEAIRYDAVLDAVQASLDAIREGNDPRILTGFSAIDAWIGGFEPGDLMYLAGRPGSGKSALGLAIARRIAGRFTTNATPGCVEVLTMEMSAVQQARRTAAARSNPPMKIQHIRAGFVEDDDYIDILARQFTKSLALERAEAGTTLWFREKVLTTDQLYLKMMQAVMERQVRVLVVDQLDLFDDDVRRGGNEQERMGTISRTLKQMAQKLGIVVIGLCQLNREVEKRADKRPILSDLRQSGRLEQDADFVGMLYRPSYYVPVPDEYQDADIAPAYEAYAELLASKNRNNRAGGEAIPLQFIPDAAMFTDWAEGGYTQAQILEFAAMLPHHTPPTEEARTA